MTKKALFRSIKFTLVELLVVISIIAILAGMIMPALSKARETALTIACMNNLKQMSLIAQTYQTEHKGYVFGYEIFHPNYHLASGNEPLMWAEWLHFENAYGMAPQTVRLPNSTTNRPQYDIQMCPAAPTESAANGTWWHTPTISNYGYNVYISCYNKTTSANERYLRKLSQAPIPSSVSTFADNWGYCEAGLTPSTPTPGPYCADGRVVCLFLGSNASIKNFRAHPNGRNTAYLDGHVDTSNNVKVYTSTGHETVWRATSNSQLSDL